MRRIALPRVVRTASFRFASLYVLLFAVSALVLGVAVPIASRNALEQQMRARIESEVAYLRREYCERDLTAFLELVRLPGRGASALDYLVQTEDGR